MNIRTVLRGALGAVLLWCSASIHAEQYTIPLFVTASSGATSQGVLRLVSDADTAATVAIHAIDDTGARIGPATLTLNALAAVQLSATELQSGSAAKGLSAGLGSLSGEVRLSIDSDVPLVPSVYVRNGAGTLSALNATVLGAAAAGRAVGSERNAYRYDVAVFHPASNVTQPSRLRLINPGDAAARVTIAARDDTGAAATGGTVQLTLPAGGARTLSANQLEAGDSTAFTGRLGAGVGNWRLSVTSDRPLQAVNVTVGLSGEWRNLSSTGISGWAPADHAAFDARFLERAIVSGNGRDRATFQVLANNRLTRTYVDVHAGTEVHEQFGPFQYERIGRDAGLLRLDYGAGVTCEFRFYFGSRNSGWYAFACVGGEDPIEIYPVLSATRTGTWLSLDAEATPLVLGSGPAYRVYTAGTAIDALTLPAASGGDGEYTYSLSPQVPGLSFDPGTRRLSGTPAETGNWTMTYRVRDASGDTDWRYFKIEVQAASGGGATTHGVGETLSDLPSGSWTPDVTSGGSFSSSGGNTTVNLNEGGYIEEGGHRYTCQSSGGCVIENRRVTSGTVIQTASGTAPGGGVADDHGDDRTTATGVEVGSDTAGVLESGDVDYFRVVIDAPGTLEAYTSGGIDTVGRLEDAEGAALGTNDEGGVGLNFRISEDVSPGTYFVLVAGFSSLDTGNYTLHVRFSGSDSGTETGDRAALMALYNATDGPNWANNQNWGSAAPLDRWHGVATDNNGRVTSIDLPDNLLSGPVPTELGSLSNLYWLDLNGNQLSGPIPPELGNLANLRLLSLYRNQISGPIPAELGNLANLGELGLGDNQLSGPIPGELGSLANLEFLGLYFNQLSGSIPAELGNLSNLDHLWLSGNQLSGPIPAELGNLSNLQTLLLEYNQLSGPIPAELGSLSNLEHLTLNSNQLSGSIPAEFGGLSNLQQLWLNGNQLSGCVPDGLRDVAVNDHSTLGLTYCGVSGTSPNFAGVSGPGNQSYTVGTAIATLTLPAASGGDGPLTYSLSPEVPGLIFNATASVRELTGMPWRAGTYDMTYRVRDTDGDTDSLSFTITIR